MPQKMQPTITQADADAARAYLCQQSLLRFIQTMNPEYIVSEFAREVCQHLEKFMADREQGLRPVLVLGAPPQHGKSEIVSRNFPAWAFARDPNLSIGGLSYGIDLATDMNRDIQRIMMSGRYGKVFPDVALNSKRVVMAEVEAKRNSETFEIVGTKGVYRAQGVGGPLTGRKLDIGIIDDPIKNSEEALSATIKEKLWKWYMSTFRTRLSQNSGQIIMATRWATDDLSGRILDSNPKAVEVKFPAISDDGEALVPELHSLEKLLEEKQLNSEYFWSAMYQQSPTVLGGDVFKREWWQYWQELPKLKYRQIFVDTAQKTKESSDYSVFQCWGYAQAATGQMQAFLIDQKRAKMEAPELLEAGRAFWAKHKATGNGTLRKMNVEDKVSGTGLIQTLKREGIPINAIQRTTDKLTRAYDAAPQIEAGNVFVPQSAPWIDDYLSEFDAFPKGTHDDQIDPTMDAAKELAAPKGEVSPIRVMV